MSTVVEYYQGHLKSLTYLSNCTIGTWVGIKYNKIFIKIMKH